jgi:hypothetical protein
MTASAAGRILGPKWSSKSVIGGDLLRQWAALDFDDERREGGARN